MYRVVYRDGEEIVIYEDNLPTREAAEEIAAELRHVMTTEVWIEKGTQCN